MALLPLLFSYFLFLVSCAKGEKAAYLNTFNFIESKCAETNFPVSTNYETYRVMDFFIKFYPHAYCTDSDKSAIEKICNLLNILESRERLNSYGDFDGLVNLSSKINNIYPQFGNNSHNPENGIIGVINRTDRKIFEALTANLSEEAFPKNRTHTKNFIDSMVSREIMKQFTLMLKRLDPDGNFSCIMPEININYLINNPEITNTVLTNALQFLSPILKLLRPIFSDLGNYLTDFSAIDGTFLEKLLQTRGFEILENAGIETSQTKTYYSIIQKNLELIATTDFGIDDIENEYEKGFEILKKLIKSLFTDVIAMIDSLDAIENNAHSLLDKSKEYLSQAHEVIEYYQSLLNVVKEMISNENSNCLVKNLYSIEISNHISKADMKAVIENCKIADTILQVINDVQKSHDLDINNLLHNPIISMLKQNSLGSYLQNISLLLIYNKEILPLYEEMLFQYISEKNIYENEILVFSLWAALNHESFYTSFITNPHISELLKIFSDKDLLNLINTQDIFQAIAPIFALYNSTFSNLKLNTSVFLSLLLQDNVSEFDLIQAVNAMNFSIMQIDQMKSNTDMIFQNLVNTSSTIYTRIMEGVNDVSETFKNTSEFVMSLAEIKKWYEINEVPNNFTNEVDALIKILFQKFKDDEVLQAVLINLGERLADIPPGNNFEVIKSIIANLTEIGLDLTLDEIAYIISNQSVRQELVSNAFMSFTDDVLTFVDEHDDMQDLLKIALAISKYTFLDIVDAAIQATEQLKKEINDSIKQVEYLEKINLDEVKDILNSEVLEEALDFIDEHLTFKNVLKILNTSQDTVEYIMNITKDILNDMDFEEMEEMVDLMINDTFTLNDLLVLFIDDETQKTIENLQNIAKLLPLIQKYLKEEETANLLSQYFTSLATIDTVEYLDAINNMLIDRRQRKKDSGGLSASKEIVTSTTLTAVQMSTIATGIGVGVYMMTSNAVTVT